MYFARSFAAWFLPQAWTPLARSNPPLCGQIRGLFVSHPHPLRAAEAPASRTGRSLPELFDETNEHMEVSPKTQNAAKANKTAAMATPKTFPPINQSARLAAG